MLIATRIFVVATINLFGLLSHDFRRMALRFLNFWETFCGPGINSGLLRALYCWSHAPKRSSNSWSGDEMSISLRVLRHFSQIKFRRGLMQPIGRSLLMRILYIWIKQSYYLNYDCTFDSIFFHVIDNVLKPAQISYYRQIKVVFKPVEELDFTEKMNSFFYFFTSLSPVPFWKDMSSSTNYL